MVGTGKKNGSELENGVRENSSSRVIVKASQSKNRKKKTVDVENMVEGGRPVKRLNVGDLSNLVQVPVEAAMQPHRIL